jgi:hypothetical protein
MRIAFLTFLCNSSDHHGHGWADQLLRAHRLGISVGRVSTIEKIAVIYGFHEEVSGTGSRALTAAGWRVWNVSAVPEAEFAMQPIYRYNVSDPTLWPRRPARVQRRPDYKCTSLKLLAWNMTHFDRVFVSDTDVCVAEDPAPWAAAHVDEYFVATPEAPHHSHIAAALMRHPVPPPISCCLPIPFPAGSRQAVPRHQLALHVREAQPTRLPDAPRYGQASCARYHVALLELGMVS